MKLVNKEGQSTDLLINGETASYKGSIRWFNHRHYDGHPATPGSQKSRIHGIIPSLTL